IGGDGKAQEENSVDYFQEIASPNGRDFLIQATRKDDSFSHLNISNESERKGWAIAGVGFYRFSNESAGSAPRSRANRSAHFRKGSNLPDFLDSLVEAKF